jgi:glutaredoxin
MKLNKYVVGGLAAILFSPVFFEIPVLWHWAEVRASERFLTSSRPQQTTTNLAKQPSIHVFGLRSCSYTMTLVQALDKWGFDYIYHDIGSWQESERTAPEMWEIVKRVHPTQKWTLPVVNVNGTPVVGYGTNIDEVTEILADQGQLPLQYIPIRVGLRMSSLLIMEILLVLYINLAYILSALVRK